MNNFLEEIRRSKDNGARMLNYIVSSSDKQPDETTKKKKTSKVNSLSSLIKNNLSTQEPVSPTINIDLEETVPEAPIEPDKTDTNTNSQYLPHNVENYSFDDALEYFYQSLEEKQPEKAGNNTANSIQSDENANVFSQSDISLVNEESETIEDKEEFLFDEDFMKKYYYDDIENNNEDNTENEAEENSSLQDCATVSPIINSQYSNNSSVSSEVCIAIGGTSDKTELDKRGLLCIEIAPSLQPSPQPKRKRGRPRKKHI